MDELKLNCWARGGGGEGGRRGSINTWWDTDTLYSVQLTTCINNRYRLLK